MKVHKRKQNTSATKHILEAVHMYSSLIELLVNIDI